MSDRDFEYAPCGNHSTTMSEYCPNCDVFALKIRIETLEAALQSIKDDYEFCQASVAGRIDRSEAYYETACKALTKEEL